MDAPLPPQTADPTALCCIPTRTLGGRAGEQSASDWPKEPQAEVCARQGQLDSRPSFA